MKKKTLSLLLLCGLMVAISSCSKDNDEDKVDKGKEQEGVEIPDASLTKPSSISLKIDGTTYDFTTSGVVSGVMYDYTTIVANLVPVQTKFVDATLYIEYSNKGEGDYQLVGVNYFLGNDYKTNRYAEVTVALAEKDQMTVFYKIPRADKTNNKISVKMKDGKGHVFMSENFELPEDTREPSTKKIIVTKIENMYGNQLIRP